MKLHTVIEYNQMMCIKEDITGPNNFNVEQKESSLLIVKQTDSVHT